MKFTHQAAVTEVVIITPEKITLEVSPSEAAIIRACVGTLRTDSDSPTHSNIDAANIYRELGVLVHQKVIPEYFVRNEFLREKV